MILFFVRIVVKINQIISLKTGAEQKVQAVFIYAKTTSQNHMPQQVVPPANKFTWEHLQQNERQKMH